jgi:hypothetical protein
MTPLDDATSAGNNQIIEPEQQFLTWFATLPLWQQRTLAHLYTMMSSPNTAYFALDGDEALRHFRNVVSMPDFPVRRVARLLHVRAVFSFVFYDVEFVRRYMLDNPGLNHGAVDVAPHHWDRCAANWRKLCTTQLSDATLHCWLMQLS